jgi:hypothetical protein
MEAVATSVARAGPVIARQSNRIACSRIRTEDKSGLAATGCTDCEDSIASVKRWLPDRNPFAAI